MAKSKVDDKKKSLKLGEIKSTSSKKVSTKKSSKSANSSGSTQGSKKRKSTKKSSGSTQKTPRVSLDPAREKLNVLVQEANERFRVQRDAGVVSRAGLEAERSLTKTDKERYLYEDMQLFHSDVKSTRALNRELSRVMNFLNDPTSLAVLDEKFESKMATGLFGGQWRKNGGLGYDQENVDAEDAELVFDIYHRVIEQGGGWDRVIGYFQLMNPGLIQHGSDVLINAIYDMVQNRDKINLSEGIESPEGEIIKRTMQMIDNMKNEYDEMAKLQLSGNDYGSILTKKELETNMAYWSFIKDKKGL